MDHSIIYSGSNYSIRKYNGIPTEAIEFLETIAWGSEGTVYEHRDTKKHLLSLNEPILYALWKDGRIKATTVLCKRKVKILSKEFNSYYFRYFAISPDLRGTGIMPRFSRQIFEALKESEKERTVYFSYVEKNNKDSYKVTELAGLKNTSSFRTIGFSRFFPKIDKRAEILAPQRRTELFDLLSDFYKEHSFVQFAPLFQFDNYHIIRENEKIVAGCLYHRVSWSVKDLPGMKGKLIMKLLPRLPLLKRLFDPKKFEFLALEAIYFENGQEATWLNLVSTLLAKEKLNTAMCWMGINCPHADSILKHGRLGLFHQFVKNSGGFVMTSGKNIDDRELEYLKSAPPYVSAYDNV